MQEAELVSRVRAALTPDLLKPPFRHNPDTPTAGHCYAASEAIFHYLGGEEAGYSLRQVRHEGVSHWFVQAPDGHIIDATVDQFYTMPPYYRSRQNHGFVHQHGVSKRAQTILDRVDAGA